jgi:hypothetical protein
MGRVEEHLKDDARRGRVLPRNLDDRSEISKRGGNRDADKAAPRPARRLRATFAAARRREPSSARRYVSYPKVL